MLLLRRQVIAIAAPCEYFEVAGVRMLASACKTLASRLHKSGSSSIQDTNLDNESKEGDHTRVSWPLDFDPRIAAPSDEARSAAVGRGGDRRVMSECENERRRMWAESSRSVPPSGASSTSCRWCGAAGRVYCGVGHDVLHLCG